MRFWILILNIFFSASFLFAQEQKCPYDEVNCTGKCGLFSDTNADGYCDRSVLCAVKEIATEKLRNIQQEKSIPQKQEEYVEIEEERSLNTTLTDDNKSTKKRPYHHKVILYSLLGCYFITYILVKTKVMKKHMHRKIWNIALTLTFLTSGLSGLILVFFINDACIPSYYLDFMTVHVDAGVAMTMIAFFHALWHLNYYKLIFKKKKIKHNV